MYYDRCHLQPGASSPQLPEITSDECPSSSQYPGVPLKVSINLLQLGRGDYFRYTAPRHGRHHPRCSARLLGPAGRYRAAFIPRLRDPEHHVDNY